MDVMSGGGMGALGEGGGVVVGLGCWVGGGRVSGIAEGMGCAADWEIGVDDCMERDGSKI